MLTDVYACAYVCPLLLVRGIAGPMRLRARSYYRGPILLAVTGNLCKRPSMMFPVIYLYETMSLCFRR